MAKSVDSFSNFLRQAVVQDALRNSAWVTLFSGILFAFAILYVPEVAARPIISVLFLITFLLKSGLRFELARRAREGAGGPKLLGYATVLHVANALFWGGIAAYALVENGILSPLTFLSLIVVLGSAANTAHEFMPSIKLVRVYVALLFGLPSVALFVRANPTDTALAAIVGLVLVNRCFQALRQARIYEMHKRQEFENLNLREQRENEARLLESVINGLNDSVVLRDLEGRYRMVNRATCEMSGKTPEELIGRTIAQALSPELEARLAEADALAREGKPSVLQYDLAVQKGQIWLQRSTYPQFDAEGKVVGLLSVSRDISQQMLNESIILSANENLERKVDERTKAFSMLAEAIPQLVWVNGVDGSSEYLNRRWSDYTGLTSLTNIAWDKIIHPDDVKEAFGKWGESLISGEAYSVEYRIRRYDGTYRWHLVRGIPSKDETGRIVKWFGTCTDIEEDRQAKEEVSRLARRNRLIIDSVGDGIIGVDHSGHISFANAATAKILGRDIFDLVGQPADSLLTGYESGQLSNGFRVAKDGRVRKSSGESFRAKDGREVRVSYSIAPIIENGMRSGAVVVFSDITEALKAEDERMQTQARERAALEASRLKSQFLANMSHEIRTPINGVVGMATLLNDTRLDDEQRSFVDTIRTSSDLLLTLINDILDFSKIESGQLHLEVTDFNLAQVVSETERLVSVAARAKGLSFFTKIDEGLASDYRGDPTRIKQILMNLTSNAVKFTSSGAVSLEISRVNGSVRFAVIDTGIGLTKDQIERLFKPFSQADASTTRKFGGTGLGLSISKSLIERMGGEVGVTSAIDHGSTFWFTLPLEVGRRVEPVAIRIVPLPEMNGQALRILLAEDNLVNQKIAVRLLEKMGCRVHVVGNGKEALDALKLDRYDLVLMDCQMPEMDGYEATRAIRTEEARAIREIPVVAMTANAMIGDREKCIEAGMNDYITKPIQVPELLRVVDAARGISQAA